MFNPASYPARHLSMESDLRVRLARRRLAHAARVRAPRPAADRVRRRDGARALPRRDGRLRRTRPRDRLPRLALDPLPGAWTQARSARTCERGMAIIERLTGARPLGWYTGRDSPNTRRLVVDHGGFEYDSDYYGDDLPFWLPGAQDRRRARAAPRRALHARLQRHALRAAAGLCQRQRVLRVPARQLRRALCRGRRAPGDDEHRHALPAARPARPHARAAALSRPCRAPRPRLGGAPDRHRPPLEARASRSTLPPPSCGNERTSERRHAPDPGPAQRRHAGGVRRAAGRHLRTLAVDRRARLGAASVREPRAAEARAASSRARGRPRRAARADPRPPRARRQGDGRQDADRRVDERAGQGRPDRLHGRGVRAHPAAQRRLQRQASASRSSSPCAGRAARAWPRRRSSRPSRAAWTTTPTSSSPSACATSTASPRSGSTTSSASRPNSATWSGTGPSGWPPTAIPAMPSAASSP